MEQRCRIPIFNSKLEAELKPKEDFRLHRKLVANVKCSHLSIRKPFRIHSMLSRNCLKGNSAESFLSETKRFLVIQRMNPTRAQILNKFATNKRPVHARKGVKAVYLIAHEHVTKVSIYGCANVMGRVMPLMNFFKGKRGLNMACLRNAIFNIPLGIMKLPDGD